jgi:hypothetical protein
MLACLFGLPSASFAADIQVDDSADAASSSPGDSKCTLSEAIRNANHDYDTTGGDCAVGSGSDIIDIPPGRYVLGAYMDVVGEVTLRGRSARLTVLDLGGATLQVAFGRVSLERLTITGGAAWWSYYPTQFAVENRGTLALSDCVVSGNDLGILTQAGAHTAIRRCSIVENRGSVALGAGDVRIENSVIAANGGGSDYYACHATIEAAALVLSFATIVDNIACGGVVGSSATARGSIFSNPSSTNCSSPIASLGHNIDSDGSCGLGDASDLSETDPQLAPRRDNGGSTPTYAVAPGSPALDALAPAACRFDHDGDPATPETRLRVDQRGAVRPLDGNGDGFAFCDIGSFELTACGDGVDNDGDGSVDLADSGCAVAIDPLEGDPEAPHCSDGFDNDEDGLLDLLDPGCSDAADAAETDASRACDDGVDNDGDFQIDTRDPGCTSDADASELDSAVECDDAADNDADSFIDRLDAGCGDSRDPSEQSSALVCDDGLDNDGDSLVDLVDPGCTSILDVAETDVLTICDDGIDNDGDGFRDQTDVGCSSRTDPSETDAALICDDGIDNDGDGYVDRTLGSWDRGCTDAFDSSERAPFACDDGVDNDGDGLLDWLDTGCDYWVQGWDTERGACQDGVNNDSDGLVDSADPGCSSATDRYEWSDAGLACDDGSDNDGDGLLDMRDPACKSPTSTSEVSQCQDGIDNDRDGRVDFDRGVSIHGSPISKRIDKRCNGKPWRNSERK